MTIPTPELYRRFLEHPAVSTDSRRIASGSLFFALRGASFDGNRFALDALDRGAALAVVDDPALAGTDPRLIEVADTLTALQELAALHRRRLGIPIVAIAGSNGKTTTKELVSRTLESRFRTAATRGNLNNHIGVPLTLLAMPSDTEIGVVEMGASACGEIARLCAIAQPDCGVLTNVGRSHLEGFGGPEGIRRGKGELYDYLAAHGGRAFVREEDSTLREMAAERPSLAVTLYPTSIADGIRSQLEGDYNRYNIAAAAAVGRHFGVSDPEIRSAIASYRPDNHRSQRIETAGNTLVVDCYNANPSSMEASIRNFLGEPAGGRRRVLILGDMLELGEWSAEEHLRILRLALSDPDADILLAGSRFTAAAERLGMPPHTVCYPDRAALEEALRRTPIRHAAILIKGSHGIGLEHLPELL